MSTTFTPVIYQLNLGSTGTLAFNWPDGAGGNANLTGWTTDVFDISTSLVGKVTPLIVTPATGSITIKINADPTLSLLWNDNYFRFRITPPSGANDAKTLERIYVDAQ